VSLRGDDCNPSARRTRRKNPSDLNKTRYSSKRSFRVAKIKSYRVQEKKMTLLDFLFPLESFFLSRELCWILIDSAGFIFALLDFN